MKTKLLALTVLGAGAMFAQSRYSVGVGVGGPAASAPPAYGAYGNGDPNYGNGDPNYGNGDPNNGAYGNGDPNYGAYDGAYDNGYYAAPPAYAYAAPSPGLDYFWIGGGWYNLGGRRLWRNGYWDYRPGYRGGYYGGSYRNEFRGNNRGFVERGGGNSFRGGSNNFRGGSANVRPNVSGGRNNSGGARPNIGSGRNSGGGRTNSGGGRNSGHEGGRR